VNLKLRNQLAEWALAALERESAEAPLRALVSFARETDPHGVARSLAEAHAAALSSAADLFERGDGGLRLRPDFLPDLDALRRRADLFERALDICRQRCGPSPSPHDPSKPRFSGGPPREPELAWTLCAASALFDVGLFFEVHEILEPLWGRAEGPLKIFLQGMIQVAVGFHHFGAGNLRGAVSLLADGNAKLRPFEPRAFGVGLCGFCDEVEQFEKSVREQMSGQERPARPTPRWTRG
jgi:hypothetical protein